MPHVSDTLVTPIVVALIGVSDDPKKLSARPFQFCQQHGFAGRIYLVNPRRETVLGQPSYKSVGAIPEPVDHAYILLGNNLVEAALDDCIAAGVRVVSVLADGYAEAGAIGHERQARLTEKANQAGITLIGPNSMGVVNSASAFVCTTNAAFKTEQLLPGRLAVLSHSGSLIGTLISRGQDRYIGFSTLISLGNEAQSCVGKIGLSLVERDDIDGFVLFLETMRNPLLFAEFAAAARRLNKPIIAYMLGKSTEGQALSVSHTGAMTGEADAVRAFLKHHDVAEVSQLDALFEAPALLLQRNRLGTRPRTVTVVTTTGGGGAMLVDQLSIRGVELGGLSAQSRAFFQENNIPCGSGKLVDVTLAGAQYEIMKHVISQLINDPETGILIVAIGSSAQFNPELAVRPIIDACAEHPGGAPVAAFPLPIARTSLAMLAAAGIPAFGGVESCADSVALLLRKNAPIDDASGQISDQIMQNIDRIIADIDSPHSSGVLDELASGEIFASLGIAGPRQVFLPFDNKGADADTAPKAVAAAGLAYPLVAKLVSADLPHKAEFGAVVLGIKDADSLLVAVAEMQTAVATLKPDAKIRGVLLQATETGLGEALVGLRHDNLVGPMVTVGAGGTLAEIYRDVSLRPAPVSLQMAREMIAEIAGFAPLRGYRGKPLGDLEALAKLVVGVSQLALIPDIAEAEINPVLVQPNGVVRLDALIRLDHAPTP